MSDLYSTIQGLEPTQQDVLEAELLARQILEANFPDMDLREGTGIRDLVLRPSAFLLALCKKGFDYHFAQNTVAGIDDSSPTEIVDGLMGNLFLTRNLGSLAVINVRLYFSRQKTVSLTTATSFSTDNTLQFYPAESVTYPDTAMQYDSFQNEWFLDIDLVAAESGTEYNINSGSLLYFGNFDPYFLHGEINYLKQVSTEAETNSEFIARAGSSISTRNLINKPSIQSRLLQDFNAISEAVVISANDEEQYRDLAEIAGGVLPGKMAISMTLSDSNQKLHIGMPGHGFVPGTLISIQEVGATNPLVLNRVMVSDLLDSGNFKVLLPITVTPRSFNPPLVSLVEEDIYVHLGGKSDVHCSRDTVTEHRQMTLDASGKCVIEGPIFNITRSSVPDGDPDTVPVGQAFTKYFNGHAVLTLGISDVAYDASFNGSVRVSTKSKFFTLGRYVTLSGWPQSSSSVTYPVVGVSDDYVYLGENIPVSVIGVGVSPTIKYVYPTADVGFSTRQEVVIDFGLAFAGGTATFELQGFEHIASVQAYLEDDDNKIICSDLLARGFDVCKLDVSLEVYDAVAPSSSEVFSLADKYVRSLVPGQDFILSELVSYLTANGISRLKTPLNVTATMFNKDLLPVAPVVVLDKYKTANSTTVFIIGAVSSITAML